MLIGVGSDVREAVRAKNLSDNPNRFVIDPKDHIDARRSARQRGLEVVGFYHSHTHAPPHPSPTDVAEASYPEALHLIVSLEGSEPSAALFRLRTHGTERLEIELL